MDYLILENYLKAQVLSNPQKVIENCELYLDILHSRINNSYKEILSEYTSDFYSSYFSLYIDGKYSSFGANNIILTGGLSVEWKWIKI